MKRLLHVVSFTTDIEASKRFYRDAMGLSLGADTPFMVNFSTDGAGLMLLAVQPTQRHEVELCFESERVSTVVETLRNRGVEFIDELRHLAFGSVIHFRDPDGNLFSLLQPGSGAAMTAAERKTLAASRREGGGDSRQTTLALDEFAPPAHTGPALTTTIVQVQDMVAARGYFGRLLGLKETVQSPYWVQYDTGDVELVIHRRNDRDSAEHYMTRAVSFGFTVEDLDEWKYAAKARGVEFANLAAEGGLGAAAQLRDPEGNTIVVRACVSDAELQKRLDVARAVKAPQVAAKRGTAKKSAAGARAKSAAKRPAARPKAKSAVAKAAGGGVTKAAVPKRAAAKGVAAKAAAPKRAASRRAPAKRAAAKPAASKRAKTRGKG